jgi:hypothetical protein
MSNPLVGLVGLLLAALGVERARRAHLEAKAESGQAKADAARRELAQRDSDAQAKVIIARQRAAETRLVEAADREARAAKDQADAQKRKENIAARWPRKP